MGKYYTLLPDGYRNRLLVIGFCQVASLVLWVLTYGTIIALMQLSHRVGKGAIATILVTGFLAGAGLPYSIKLSRPGEEVLSKLWPKEWTLWQVSEGKIYSFTRERLLDPFKTLFGVRQNMSFSFDTRIPTSGTGMCWVVNVHFRGEVDAETAGALKSLYDDLHALSRTLTNAPGAAAQLDDKFRARCQNLPFEVEVSTLSTTSAV